MNIVQAVQSEQLFRPYLTTSTSGSLHSWQGWMSVLKLIYGLPTDREERRLLRRLTGRKRVRDVGPFQESLMCCGRRSGKSKIASLICAFEACFGGHERKLSAGEIGVVCILSPTLRQSRICASYIRGALKASPVLRRLIAREDAQTFTLRSGIQIECLAGSYRTARGHSVVCCIVDEVAQFHDEETHKSTDAALIQAIRPSLATTQGRLICLTTKYLRRGWYFRTWKKHYKNDEGKILVIDAASRVLNETLPESVVSQAVAEDPQAARSEYLGRFRQSVGAWIPRSVVERCVVRGRLELPPAAHHHYHCFVDMSGGRVESAAMAIAHREGDRTVLDFTREWKAPYAPVAVVGLIAEQCRRWGVTRVVADAYAAEWASSTFKTAGLAFEKSAKNKSQLYAELLPRLSSQQIDLIDDERLISQLASLERHVRTGGRETVDHPVGLFDDVANAAAGAIYIATCSRQRVGLLFSQTPTGYPIFQRPVTRDEDPIGHAIRDLRRSNGNRIGGML